MMSKTSTWSQVQLGKVLTYIDELVELEDNTEYTTITVKRRHGGLEARERIFGSQIRTKKQFKLIPGVFIISRVQCWHQAYAIVPDTIRPNMIASTNYDQFILSPEVDKHFFWWFSHSPIFTEVVRSCAFGVVIEKMVFNRDRWLQQTIPLPPLEEQHRIVTRIEELATRIEEARGLRREAKEETEKVIFHIVSNLQFDERYWATVGTAILDKEGSVRSGPFGSQLHHDEFVESGVAAIGTRDVQVNRFKLISGWYVTDQKFEQFNRYQVFPGDVLGTIVGASIGRFCVVPENVPLAFTTKHIIALTLDPSKALPEFISYLLNFHIRCRASLFAQSEGSAQPSLNSPKILRTEIPLPPILEQRRIVAYINDLYTKVKTLQQLQFETSAELNALLPSILDKAFKGEL